MSQTDVSQDERDQALLQKFGYKQNAAHTGFSPISQSHFPISLSRPARSLFSRSACWQAARRSSGRGRLWLSVSSRGAQLRGTVLSFSYCLALSINGANVSQAIAWLVYGLDLLFAGILTITSVAFTVPIPLLAIFPGIQQASWDCPVRSLLPILSIVVGTVINVAGVRIMAIINNVGVVAEIIGMIGFALVLLLFFNHQPLSFLFSGPSPKAPVVQTAALPWTPGLGTGYAGAFAAAFIHVSLRIFTASIPQARSVKKPKIPRRNAPRGVLWSIGPLVYRWPALPGRHPALDQRFAQD